MADVKIAVFGTLRRGFSAHALMRGNGTKYVDSIMLPDYFVMDMGFPGAFHKSKFNDAMQLLWRDLIGSLKVEVYHVVDDRTLWCLNRYEGVPDLFDLVPVIGHDDLMMYQYQGNMDWKYAIAPNQMGVHDWAQYKKIAA